MLRFIIFKPHYKVTGQIPLTVFVSIRGFSDHRVNFLQGAQEMFQELPHIYVEPHELKKAIQSTGV